MVAEWNPKGEKPRKMCGSSGVLEDSGFLWYSASENFAGELGCCMREMATARVWGRLPSGRLWLCGASNIIVGETYRYRANSAGTKLLRLLSGEMRCRSREGGSTQAVGILECNNGTLWRIVRAQCRVVMMLSQLYYV